MVLVDGGFPIEKAYHTVRPCSMDEMDRFVQSNIFGLDIRHISRELAGCRIAAEWGNAGLKICYGSVKQIKIK